MLSVEFERIESVEGRGAPSLFRCSEIICSGVSWVWESARLIGIVCVELLCSLISWYVLCEIHISRVTSEGHVRFSAKLKFGSSIMVSVLVDIMNSVRSAGIAGQSNAPVVTGGCDAYSPGVLFVEFSLFNIIFQRLFILVNKIIKYRFSHNKKTVKPTDMHPTPL